jgi:hypothetical protein
MINKLKENRNIKKLCSFLLSFSTSDKTNTQLQAHGRIYKEEGQIPPITSSNVQVHLNIKQILLQGSQQASQ